jgi:hypothetical protein
MVSVRLAREWVDDAGASHAAGETVDVDAGTLARLEQSGVVATPGEPVPAPAPEDARDAVSRSH